jgi:hypothetical protein
LHLQVFFDSSAHGINLKVYTALWNAVSQNVNIHYVKQRGTSPNSQGNYEQSEAIGSEKAQVPLLTPPCNASPREPPTKHICKQQRARVFPIQVANIETYPLYHDPSQHLSLIASPRHLRHVYESDECHLVDALGNVENFAEAFDAAGFF